MVYFQHNDLILTRKTYTYVYRYKQQIVRAIYNLLTDLNIRFVISYGNLIEYERQMPIYHDDDVDVRFSVEDWDKWVEYCQVPSNINNPKYNLVFDDRFGNMDAQKYNGIQARLIEFENPNNIQTFNTDVHLDLVASVVELKFWPDFDIDFNKINRVTYIGSPTFVPNDDDTQRVLTQQYGPNYLIPYPRYAVKFTLDSLNLDPIRGD